MEFYHETVLENLPLIFQSKCLKRSSETKGVRVQGSSHRRTTSDPFVSVNVPDFYEFYDEVDAVYFRVRQDPKESLQFNNGNVILVFDAEAILKNISAVINTTENFGFIMDTESQFSGEPGKSFYSVPSDIPRLTTEEFSLTDSEVAVLGNVSLEFLKETYIKKR